MLSFFWMATTVIGRLSFRFSSLRLPRGAPTSPSVRVSRVRARPGASLARPVRQLACGQLDHEPLRIKDQRSRSVPRCTRRRPPLTRARRDHLRMGGRDDPERRTSGIPDCRSASQLSPARREIEDQRHLQRHRWCDVVHSQWDRALLFPRTKKHHATVGVKSHAAILMEPRMNGDEFR